MRPPHRDHLKKHSQHDKLGLNDGMVFGKDHYPAGTPEAVMRREALNQPYLRGPINVPIVLVQFQDKKFSDTDAKMKSKMQDLFFSENKLQTGSVNEYYKEVSAGKISITGEVFGPFTLPLKMKDYAHNDNGKDLVFTDATRQTVDAEKTYPNTMTMGTDTVNAVINAKIDLSKFDNHAQGRAPGYVDGFVIVHSGSDASHTQAHDDIWSVKWSLKDFKEIEVPNTKSITTPQGSTKVAQYLTVSEDTTLGTACHEFGHLLFGWPDLYDYSGDSYGVGNWCLMGYGGNIESNGVSTPCHPSAWCKASQGWVDVNSSRGGESISLNEVKPLKQGKAPITPAQVTGSGNVLKLWKNGNTDGKEYFLLENRGKNGYDLSLPGEGLLIWHIDEEMEYNNNMYHRKVDLMCASPKALKNKPVLSINGTAAGLGDESNPFPGTSGNRAFTGTTAPNSNSYYDPKATNISVTNISPYSRGNPMKMSISLTQTSRSKL